MNNISSKKAFIAFFIIFFIFIIITVLLRFYLKQTHYFILGVVACGMTLYWLIKKSLMSDITLINEKTTLVFTSLFSKKIIEVSKITVEEIEIDRFPGFKLTLNNHSYLINYTKHNYYEIIALLILLKYKGVNHFFSKVEKFSIDLRY